MENGLTIEKAPEISGAFAIVVSLDGREGLQLPAPEDSLLLVVNLQPLAGALQHVDAPLVVHLYGDGPVEQLLPLVQVVGHFPALNNGQVQLDSLAAPLGQSSLTKQLCNKVTLGIEDLQSVVLEIRDVDDAFLVHGHLGGPVEFAISVAAGAKLHQELPVGRELLDAVVPPVGHPDVAVVVNLNAPRDN